MTSLLRPFARICAAGVLLLAAPACHRISTTEAPSGWHRLRLGLCEDYPEESRSLASAREDFRTARDAGAPVLRVAFGWDAMEPSPGQYDWSFWDDYVRIAVEQYGIELIPYVCYTPRWAATDPGSDYWHSPPRDPEDFGRFVSVLVRRYRRWIHSWELWNEPDNPAYWLGTPAQFAELVRAGARAVRHSDPSANVVLGGLAGRLEYLETLFRDEHLAPAVDVVNFHSYFETWHPDPIERLPAEVARASEIVERYGEREPLWMAETGYSTVGPRPETSAVYHARYRDEHTPAAQAGAVLRTIALAASTGRLSTLAWYRLRDLPPAEEVIGDDNNRHLGLLSVEGDPKPALTVFTRLAALFHEPYRSVPVSVEGAPGEACEAHAFEFADGRRALFAWLPRPGSAPANTPVSADQRERDVTLRLRLTGDILRRATDLVSGKPTAIGRWQRGSELRLSVHLRGGTVLALELRPR